MPITEQQGIIQRISHFRLHAIHLARPDGNRARPWDRFSEYTECQLIPIIQKEKSDSPPPGEDSKRPLTTCENGIRRKRDILWTLYILVINGHNMGTGKPNVFTAWHKYQHLVVLDYCSSDIYLNSDHLGICISGISSTFSQKYPIYNQRPPCFAFRKPRLLIPI